MTRGGLRARATVVVAVVALASCSMAAAATAPVVSPAEVSAPSERVEPPRPVLVIGDSAISAVRWVPGASTAVLGVDRTLDLESCRRLVQASCRGREGRTPPTAVEALRATGGTYHTVVIATGYNDGAGGFEHAVRTIIAQARAQGIERVVWWTLRTDVTYVSPGDFGYQATFAANNARLRLLADSGEFPELVIADWNSYTDSLDHWFTADGVHYRTIAAWGAADYLSRKLAHLDGRPCPMPERLGETRPAPCPDPDVTGPVAEISELYQIGVSGVLCYEVGVARDPTCRAWSSTAPELAEVVPG